MSLSSFANLSWLKQLPPDAFECSLIELYPFSPSSHWLQSVEPIIQQKSIETWFLHRFYQPKIHLSYDGKHQLASGFHSKTFSVEYELLAKFHQIVPEETIMRAVAALSGDSDHSWVVRHQALVDAPFGQCDVLQPLEPFKQRLSKLYVMIHELNACHMAPWFELVYFEAIRGFELYCIELLLYQAANSDVVLERLIKMLLLSNNEPSRIVFTGQMDSSVLDTLRQRLLLQPWYHWPTFVYLIRDALEINVSLMAGDFGRVYGGQYRKQFGFSPRAAISIPELSKTTLLKLKLSLLRLAKKLHEAALISDKSDKKKWILTKT